MFRVSNRCLIYAIVGTTTAICCGLFFMGVLAGAGGTDSNPPVTTRIPEVSGTRYIAVNTANVRACPATTCTILGKLTFGKSFEARGQEGDWWVTYYSGQVAYIHDDITSSSRPVATPNVGTGGGGSGNACAGRRPGNCATARSYGLDARTIASCWSYLDRDHDGVACYDD